MKINDSSNQHDSLYHDALEMLGIDTSDTTTLSVNQFILSANNWYRRADSWIWESSGDWEFDDRNRTTFPIATADLVDQQQDYSLPSNARAVQRVEVLDSSGDAFVVHPIDDQEVNLALTEYLETPSLPLRYRMVGRSLFLYPSPSSSQTTLSSGLKVYFSSDIDEFASDDTTKEPGFDNHFHRILSYGSVLDFASAKEMPEVANNIEKRLAELQAELKTFYGKRHTNYPTRMRLKNVRPRI